MRVDPAVAHEFLSHLYPDGPWDLVTIKPDGGKDDKLHARSFRPPCADELSAFLGEAARVGRNVYYHVNPVNWDTVEKARPRRENMRAVHFVHVDVDLRVRPEGRSYDEHRQKERERILGLLDTPPGNIPRAPIVVSSGNGYNALWRLEAPIPLDGTVTTADDACKYNRGVELAFTGALQTYDVSRILRVPGSINFPNESKRKRGYTACEATLVRGEAGAWPLSAFPVAYESNQAPSRPGTNGARGPAPKLRAPSNVERTGDPQVILRMVHADFLTEVSGHLLRTIEHGHDPQDPDRYPSRSEASWYVTCELVRLKVSDDDIYAVITDPGLGISEHVLHQASPDRYAMRQIERARERALDPALGPLNDKHTVIRSLGGQCVVVEEMHDPILNRSFLDVQSFESFAKQYMNHSVTVMVPDKNGNPVARQVEKGKWWLKHPHRSERQRVVFYPGHETPADYNLWQGFAYAPQPGDGHERFMLHVHDNVCSGDARLFKYLVGWMALAVQKPDRPGQTAIVLRGAPGAGKGTLARTFGALWGRHYIQVTHADHITGRFNDHLRDAVVVFADEAFYAGDKRHEKILLGMITEAMTTIEAKYEKATPAANFVHLMMASNSDWVVPVSSGDRRFVVIDVGDRHVKDREYWTRLDDSLKAQGGAAFGHLLHFLQNYDLTGYEVRDIPDTAARRDQQLRSLPVDDEWWLRKLEAGNVLPRTPWANPVSTQRAWEDYSRYLQQQNQQRRSNESAFWLSLQKLCPGVVKARRDVEFREVGPGGVEVVASTREQAYVFPTLEKCRKLWDAAHGPHDWPVDDSPF